MIDIVSTKYGWFYKDITDKMYWEEFYEMYEHAYNMHAIEKNEDNHFQFMIHAQSQEAMNAWKNSPVPFPDRAWNPPAKRKEELPRVFKDKSKIDKATPEQVKRAEEVRATLAKHAKERAEKGL